jgi:hypothetical protein
MDEMRIDYCGNCEDMFPEMYEDCLQKALNVYFEENDPLNDSDY